MQGNLVNDQKMYTTAVEFCGKDNVETAADYNCRKRFTCKDFSLIK